MNSSNDTQTNSATTRYNNLQKKIETVRQDMKSGSGIEKNCISILYYDTRRKANAYNELNKI